MIKELVTFVVQQLVLHPQEVVINFIQKDDIDLVEIKVSTDDRGRVIGKEGHTIKALRVLVDTVTSKDKKILLELSR
jgi:hypothetical protein